MKQQFYHLCRSVRKSKSSLWRFAAIMSMLLPFCSLDTFADDYEYPQNYFKLVSTGNVTLKEPYVDFDVMVVNYDGIDDDMDKSPIYINNGTEEVLVGYVDFAWSDGEKSLVHNLDNFTEYGRLFVVADKYRHGQDSDYKITKFRYYYGDKVLRMCGLKKTPLGYVQNNKYTMKMRIEEKWDFDHDSKQVTTKKGEFTLPDVDSEWGQNFSVTLKRTNRYTVTATVNAPKADESNRRVLVFHDDDNYVVHKDARYLYSQDFSPMEGTYSVPIQLDFDPSREYDVWSYCSTVRGSTIIVAHGKAMATDEHWFNSPRCNVLIPDCWHASSLVATPDMWKKNVTLTWEADCSQPALAETNGAWYIFKYAGDLTTKGATPRYVGKVPFKGARDTYSFTDDSDSYDTSYVYIVSFGLNGWSDLDVTPVNELARKVEVTNQRDWDMQLYTERRPSSILLEWEHERVPEANASPFYVEHRTSQSEPWTILAELNEPNITKHSWQHRDLVDMEEVHYYRIRTHLLDTDFTVEDVNTTLGTNAIRSLTASKGTYAGEVHLSWECEMNNNREMNFEIFRRLSGSNAEWVQLGEMRGTAQTFTFVDDTPVPGNYYDYRVSSTYLEDDGHRTNPVFCGASGFSMSTGIISGKVTYGTGTAVAGVKMNLGVDSDDPKQTQFYSMRVRDIGGGLKLLRPTEELASLYTNPFTAQLWAYITPNEGTPIAQSIIDAQYFFTLLAVPQSDGTYRLVLEQPDGAQMTSDIYLRSHLYYNISVSMENGQVTLRALDSRDKKLKTCVLEQNIEQSQFVVGDDGPIAIYFGGKRYATSAGPYFMGYIDDVRLWRTALSDSLVLATYDKVLSGQETGLAMYLPLDENIPGQQTAYDYSMNANGIHNEWHADVRPGTKPDTNVPGSSLSLYAMTDEMGNYIIRGIPYTGEGTYYIVRPTMGLHEFSPSFVSRYISPNSLVHSGVNFKDVSSIPVSGQAFYKGTRYPVEGADLYVDGQPVMIDGDLAQTDVEGKFQISVPIGKHFIEIRKNGHTFENGGRYPADPNNEVTTFTFEKEVTGLRFTDETLVTIAGRVCGGPTETEKPLGFGDSRNNIGTAEITLDAGYPMNIQEVVEDGIIVPYPVADNAALDSPTDQVESEAYVSGGKTADETRYIHITTDRKTGEFAVKLPPVVFNVTDVKVPSNSKIQFANLPTIDATELDILADSISYDSINTLYFKYAAALKQTYRSAPEMEVVDARNEDKKAFGEKWVPYYNNTGGADSVLAYKINDDNVVDYTFGHPILAQAKGYYYVMRVSEKYLNYDNPTDIRTYLDPVAKANIRINNEFSTNKSFYFKGEQRGQMVDPSVADTVSTDEEGLASYSFRAGMPNVLDDHTLGLNITYEVDEKTYEWDQNGKFRVIVLGDLTHGNDYITKGPDQVEYVLRDPPGSNSSATFHKMAMHQNQWIVKVTGGSSQDIRRGTGKRIMATQLRIVENTVVTQLSFNKADGWLADEKIAGNGSATYVVSPDGAKRAMTKAIGPTLKWLTAAYPKVAFSLQDIMDSEQYEKETLG